MDFCSEHEGFVRRGWQCSQCVLEVGIIRRVGVRKGWGLTLISIQVSIYTIEMAICRAINTILDWWAHAEV